MIDIRFIRENADVVRASQRGRGEDPLIVDKVLAADDARRAAIVEFESLRAEQNIFSKSVGAAKGAERDALLEKGKSLSAQVKVADTRRAEAEKNTQDIALLLSNVLDPAAPIGDEEDFVVLEHVGIPRDFSKLGFEPRDHVELGKLLGAIDTERGAKVAGSRS
jgi:seryl-tRNA synthetase